MFLPKFALPLAILVLKMNDEEYIFSFFRRSSVYLYRKLVGGKISLVKRRLRQFDKIETLISSVAKEQPNQWDIGHHPPLTFQ